MATVDCNALTANEASTVKRAVAILERHLYREPEPLASPGVVRQFLAVRYAAAPREVFGAFFLDTQLRLLAFDELFHGTLTQTSVFPREIVRAALLRNAAAVVFVHNHPSGVPAPSEADKLLTKALIDALRLVDVRVLDHFVVGGLTCLSFAEMGLLGAAPNPPPAKKKRPRARPA